MARQSKRKTEAYRAKHSKATSERIGRIYARAVDEKLILRLEYEPRLAAHLYGQKIKSLVHRIYEYGYDLGFDETSRHWMTFPEVLERLKLDNEWLIAHDFELVS